MHDLATTEAFGIVQGRLAMYFFIPVLKDTGKIGILLVIFNRLHMLILTLERRLDGVLTWSWALSIRTWT